MIIFAVCLLTGCAAKRSLTITLDDSCKDAEAFVAVYDKNGKDMGGGNVMSNGPLMVLVNDGTYTVKVTEITGDGYEIPEPADVTVKGDTQYKIVLTEKVSVTEETAAKPDDEIPETIEAYEPGPEETEEAETQIEEIPERGEVLFDEKEKAYADIIDLHKKAMAENWDMGQYSEHDMSFLFGYCKSEEEVGFDLMYFDDSKYPMLLMGTILGDDFSDMMIMDGYYLHEDGQMDHVFTSGERYRHYWMPDESGPQLIAYEGSSSASTGYNYYYIVDNGKLKCVQGIVFDHDADPENPYYQVYEDNFSIEGGEPVSEEYAREITEAYAKQYRKVPYRPISEGYDFIAE